MAHVSAVKFSGDVGVVREALGAARRVTVVGDGLTGVEHAAELALWAKQRGASLEVRLTGRQELPLPHMPTSLRVCAARALEALGLARSSELVELPSEVGAAAGAQELFIWATGTAPVAGLEGLPRVEGGFVPVDRWLRVRGLERVFAIGDLARLHDEQGRVVPTTMRAAEAIFQGAWLGPRLRALCAGDSCAPYDAKPDFPFYGISLGDRAVFAYRRFGRNSRAGAAFRRFLTVAYWARLRL